MDVPAYLMNIGDEYLSRLQQTGKKDFNDLLDRVKPKDRENLASYLNTLLALQVHSEAIFE